MSWKNLESSSKKKRLAMSYTQNELATRSGVSLGWLKRFETSGQISLESLLKLAFTRSVAGATALEKFNYSEVPNSSQRGKKRSTKKY